MNSKSVTITMSNIFRVFYMKVSKFCLSFHLVYSRLHDENPTSILINIYATWDKLFSETLKLWHMVQYLFSYLQFLFLVLSSVDFTYICKMEQKNNLEFSFSLIFRKLTNNRKRKKENIELINWDLSMMEMLTWIY